MQPPLLDLFLSHHDHLHVSRVYSILSSVGLGVHLGSLVNQGVFNDQSQPLSPHSLVIYLSCTLSPLLGPPSRCLVWGH